VRIHWAFAGSPPVFLHYILHQLGNAWELQPHLSQWRPAQPFWIRLRGYLGFHQVSMAQFCVGPTA
jgi:hypothetical protein